MNKETANKIARAMDRAGYQEAAAGFVSERSYLYNDYHSRRLEKIWLS
jgi:hypothetical protein